ncbi:hypothetical protein, partial [Massilia sp. CCM 8734]|uniref:hypothetical protein n=1 Tax=Massilia sp. CCM 8734 TaxID=2609283 RepID=UPI001AAEF3F3
RSRRRLNLLGAIAQFSTDRVKQTRGLALTAFFACSPQRCMRYRLRSTVIPHNVDHAALTAIANILWRPLWGETGRSDGGAITLTPYFFEC